jgi:hypothetical protein
MVQEALPAGGSLHARAMTNASWRPLGKPALPGLGALGEGGVQALQDEALAYALNRDPVHAGFGGALFVLVAFVCGQEYK